MGEGGHQVVHQVLFLCTGNSARSILAEAILNRMAPERFHALSAGSHPRGAVHPLALALLRERGHDVSALRSKSWDEFGGPAAPRLDFVFTVCDAAAGESCPIWPGAPITAHWGIADPATAPGSEDERRWHFRRAYLELERRIELFTQLRFEALERGILHARLEAIGKRPEPSEEPE